jgi:DNA-binding response OmpR family regulator
MTAICDVLLVEDDPEQNEEMAGFLGRAGLAVSTARSGDAALRKAGECSPRVAILDYNLPDCTGLELAERLRALLPQTAILMMSGRLEGLSEETLRRIGIKAFVNKPVPLRALRQAVVQLSQKPAPARVVPVETGWLTAGLGGTRA